MGRQHKEPYTSFEFELQRWMPRVHQDQGSGEQSAKDTGSEESKESSYSLEKMSPFFSALGRVLNARSGAESIQRQNIEVILKRFLLNTSL